MLKQVPGRRRDTVLSGYDTAQVCVEGHIINMVAESRQESNKEHCTACGAATIMACPHCQEPIHGYHHVANALFPAPVPDEAPSFCHKCGKAYPWVETKLAVATSLIQEADGLSDSEKEALTKSLDDLVRDVPATEVALVRFKKYLPKAGAALFATFKEVMISAVSEGVKKRLFGP